MIIMSNSDFNFYLFLYRVLSVLDVLFCLCMADRINKVFYFCEALCDFILQNTL